MNHDLTYQIIGYAASVLIALSMMMNSILRLRIINLVGASSMTVYGVLIGAYPIAVLNAFIVAVDCYYLLAIFRKREFFSLLQVRPTAAYLRYFLDFYGDDIDVFLPGFRYTPDEGDLVFFVLRDMVPAGLMITEGDCGEDATVHLDYVVPGYRDFKVGHFVFCERASIFRERGIRRLASQPGTNAHEKYLRRMGFAPAVDGDGRPVFVLDLEYLPDGSDVGPGEPRVLAR